MTDFPYIVQCPECRFLFGRCSHSGMYQFRCICGFEGTVEAVKDTPFSRSWAHDPAELNALNDLLREGISDFTRFTDRFGTAVLILESDWLKNRLEAAWRAGHGWCDDGIDGMCTHQPFEPGPVDNPIVRQILCHNCAQIVGHSFDGGVVGLSEIDPLPGPTAQFTENIGIRSLHDD